MREVTIDEVGDLRETGDQFCKLIGPTGDRLTREAIKALGLPLCTGKRCTSVRLGDTKRCPCVGRRYGGGYTGGYSTGPATQITSAVQAIQEGTVAFEAAALDAGWTRPGVYNSTWLGWATGVVDAVRGIYPHRFGLPSAGIHTNIPDPADSTGNVLCCAMLCHSVQYIANTEIPRQMVTWTHRR